MTIDPKVFDFPNIPIQSQIFYASGMAYDGGFTTGGARISSPEPGGRAFLEINLSLRNEWNDPKISWLMSKTNGDIFRIQLTRTPQLVSDEILKASLINYNIPWTNEGIFPESAWDNNQFWDGEEYFILPTISSLEGTTTLTVDTSVINNSLKLGHVIGHLKNTYIIDDIMYNGNIATITVKPPLRHDVTLEDFILLKPFFTGQIDNGSEFRTGYEAANNGNIQVSRIILSEVIL